MSAGMVIIGAGHAAVRAAIAIREAHYTGPVVMIAAEGSELPYERPPLSKWSAETAADELKPLLSPAKLDEANIERYAAEVVRIDAPARQVFLSDGSSRSYDKLLLATGASARRLPESLVGQSPVHYLRNAEDARHLKQAADTAEHAVIVGGGFIGLELAASLRTAGLAVHVVEAADRLLARAVSAPVASIVQQLHAQRDVQFSLGARIDEISLPPGIVRLSEEADIQTDLVLAGIGSAPAEELARTAALDEANGIRVDAHLCSSDPDIYAAGDCCSFPLYGHGGPATRLESWQAAGDQGALAGYNMVSKTPGMYTNVPWFWSEQYDHVLQVAGLPVDDMVFVQRAYGDTHHITFGLNANGSLGYACGIAPGLKIAKDVRFAMKLIESGVSMQRESLADPAIALKSLR